MALAASICTEEINGLAEAEQYLVSVALHAQRLLPEAGISRVLNNVHFHATTFLKCAYRFTAFAYDKADTIAGNEHFIRISTATTATTTTTCSEKK
jgi:hypothetical protein